MAVVLGEATGGQRTVRAANLLEHGFQSYGWKALFNHNKSLDSMPIAADAKAVMSVRKQVKSFECGTGVRKTPAKKKGVRKKPRPVDGAAVEAQPESEQVAKAPAEPEGAPLQHPKKPAQAGMAP
jgi:D-alanyl-D-alanine carboxypeptidase